MNDNQIMLYYVLKQELGDPICVIFLSEYNVFCSVKYVSGMVD